MEDVIISIISLWDFFQTLKGSQLRSPWSDLAKFRTHSSSYVYHHNLQVRNESDQKLSRKCNNTVFPTVTLSVAMETSGRIWLNFELIQAPIHVLITCKYKKDPIKNSGENMMTSFSQLYVYGIFFIRSRAATPKSLVRSGRILNSSEMLWMFSLPASMKKI